MVFKVVPIKVYGHGTMYTVKFRQWAGWSWHDTGKRFHTVDEALAYKTALRKLDLGIIERESQND